MHLKVFMKLEKNPKNPLVWAKKPKKPKKTKKTQKTQKNPKNLKKTKKTQKNPLGWVFFLKNPGFFQPCWKNTYREGIVKFIKKFFIP